MAAAKSTTKKGTPKKQEEYVSLARFEALESGVSRILDVLEAQKAAPVATPSVAAPMVQTEEEKKISKAGPNEIPMNPEWEDLAREVIGDALDHCEIAYVKNGGVLFTIVIKDEFSNAGKDYLERYKSDRRTKEVGSEGIEGVENWCKLVKANLSKGTPLARRSN